MGEFRWRDHAFTILTASWYCRTKDQIIAQPIREWSDDAVIVDGWTGDYYWAKHPFDPRKSGSIPNPFQLAMRHKIHKFQGHIRVDEECTWPPQFSPNFRLEKAHLRNVEYERVPHELAGIVDNEDAFTTISRGIIGIG